MATEAISWRDLTRVERRQDHIEDAAMSQGETLARHDETLKEHSSAITALTGTVNKLVWALVGFSLTVAGSAVGLALTIVLTRPAT